MDQIGEYLTSSWVVGILAVTVTASALAIVITWVLKGFFAVLEEDEKGADR